MSKDLLDYNQRGALAHVLAVEEHLQGQPAGVNNSWCAQKHALLAVDHHLSEAVNHASRIDPQLAERYRKLKLLAEHVLKPSSPGELPDLAAVAGLRNTMRAAFGDPTLNSDCPVCSKDTHGLMGLGGGGRLSGQNQGMSLIQELRKPRVGPFAVFDFAAALGAAYLVAPKLGVKRKHALLAAIPVGVLVHELLGIDTPLNRMIFGRR